MREKEKKHNKSSPVASLFAVQQLDFKTLKVLEAMNADSIDPWLPQTTKEDWRFENGYLYFKNHLHIPEDAWKELVESIHESPARGHRGFF